MSSCGSFIRNTIIQDHFWQPLREMIRKDAIPYQWLALNDRIETAEVSGCIKNFRIAAGKEHGKHTGFLFQDSDVAKWLEGVAYSLTWHPDPELEKTADQAIEEIVAVQQPDGYLDTYYIINASERRWSNLMDAHELYCAGHLIEAAVAYFEATGKRKLLDAVIRLADHIDSRFGAEEGKIHGYPGHPEIELALMRLYRVTQNERYAKLASYFVLERGKQPLFFEKERKENNNHCDWIGGPLGYQYYQANKPLLEQDKPVGHAVRALYLLSGAADVANHSKDSLLSEAVLRIWNQLIQKQMYITGGVGSSPYGESFTYDYYLPNDTAYAETCASIALVFLAQRMLNINICSEYADIMERALFNGIISGIQLDGKKFFYVNPLEVVPEACEKDGNKQHVKVTRQKWFGCACCPPNLVRLLASLHQYIYSVKKDTLYVHLYVSGNTKAEINGEQVSFSTETQYPWNGLICFCVNLDAPKRFSIAMRIPGWCDTYSIKVGGQEFLPEKRDGYIYLSREWMPGDEIQLQFKMEVTFYRAHPSVRSTAGQLAVMRGPIVYCLEEADNGADLHLLHIGDIKPEAFTLKEASWLKNAVVLESSGEREDYSEDSSMLYRQAHTIARKPVVLRWIPYYAWANRTPGEMRVWIRE